MISIYSDSLGLLDQLDYFESVEPLSLFTFFWKSAQKYDMFRVKVYGADIWCFGVLLLRDFHFVNSLLIFDHICRLIWFEFPPKPKSNQSWKRQFQSDPNVRCNTPANSISQFWIQGTMMEKLMYEKYLRKKNISSKQSKREFNLLQKSGKVTDN